MIITITPHGDYKALYRGLSAFGFTPTQAIINLMTILK
jgi:hypothetical protein